jgi:hypothetical protein
MARARLSSRFGRLGAAGSRLGRLASADRLPFFVMLNSFQHPPASGDEPGDRERPCRKSLMAKACGLVDAETSSA